MRLIFLSFLFLFSSTFLSQQTIDATIIHNGLTREYKIYVPAIYNGSVAVPLVYNLHGYTSNNLEQMYYGDFRAIADTANFILVLPQGTIDNQGNTYWNSYFFGATDDLGFLDVLIDSINLQYNIDLDRIYSTGMSNGGFMSYMLACELSSRITAVASVTGTMTTFQVPNCTPNRPVPIMEVHGTADPTVPYNGGAGMLSVDSVLNYWIANNNCSTSPIITNLPDINLSDSSTAIKYEYLQGDLGSEVVHYKIIGGEHTWPGTVFTTLGVTNLDFNASVEIWNFFSKYKTSDFTNVSVSESKKEIELLKLTSENPFESYLSFSVETEDSYVINIVDITGKIVFSKKYNANHQIVELNHLASGYYILRVDTNKGSASKKIIKK